MDNNIYNSTVIHLFFLDSRKQNLYKDNHIVHNLEVDWKVDRRDQRKTCSRLLCDEIRYNVK